MTRSSDPSAAQGRPDDVGAGRAAPPPAQLDPTPGASRPGTHHTGNQPDQPTTTTSGQTTDPTERTPSPDPPAFQQVAVPADALALFELHAHRFVGREQKLRALWAALIRHMKNGYIDVGERQLAQELSAKGIETSKDAVHEWIKLLLDEDGPGGLLELVQDRVGSKSTRYQVVDPGRIFSALKPGRPWVRHPNLARPLFDRYVRSSDPKLRLLWNALIDAMAADGSIAPKMSTIGVPFGWDGMKVLKQISLLTRKRLLYQVEKGKARRPAVFGVLNPAEAGPAVPSGSAIGGRPALQREPRPQSRQVTSSALPVGEGEIGSSRRPLVERRRSRRVVPVGPSSAGGRVAEQGEGLPAWSGPAGWVGHRIAANGDCLFNAVRESAHRQGVRLVPGPDPVADSAAALRAVAAAALTPALSNSIMLFEPSTGQLLSEEFGLPDLPALQSLMPDFGFHPTRYQEDQWNEAAYNRVTRDEARRRYPHLGPDTPLDQLRGVLPLDWVPQQDAFEGYRDGFFRSTLLTEYREALAGRIDAGDPVAHAGLPGLVHAQPAISAGTAALIRVITGYVNTHRRVPDRHELLRQALLHTELWNTRVGDDLPRALALTLNLNIVIHEQHGTAELPAADPTTVDTIHIQRSNGDHYDALELAPPREDGPGTAMDTDHEAVPPEPEPFPSQQTPSQNLAGRPDRGLAAGTGPGIRGRTSASPPVGEDRAAVDVDQEARAQEPVLPPDPADPLMFAREWARALFQTYREQITGDRKKVEKLWNAVIDKMGAEGTISYDDILAARGTVSRRTVQTWFRNWYTIGLLAMEEEQPDKAPDGAPTRYRVADPAAASLRAHDSTGLLVAPVGNRDHYDAPEPADPHGQSRSGRDPGPPPDRGDDDWDRDAMNIDPDWGGGFTSDRGDARSAEGGEGSADGVTAAQDDLAPSRESVLPEQDDPGSAAVPAQVPAEASAPQVPARTPARVPETPLPPVPVGGFSGGVRAEGVSAGSGRRVVFPIAENGDCLFNAVRESARHQGVRLVAGPDPVPGSAEALRAAAAAALTAELSNSVGVFERSTGQLVSEELELAALQDLARDFVFDATERWDGWARAAVNQATRDEARRRGLNRDASLDEIRRALPPGWAPQASDIWDHSQRYYQAGLLGGYRGAVAELIDAGDPGTLARLADLLDARPPISAGTAALIRVVLALVNSQGSVPDRHELLRQALLRTELWDTRVGDDLPRVLALTLNVNIVVHEPHGMYELPARDPRVQTLHIQRRNRDHYEALGPSPARAAASPPAENRPEPDPDTSMDVDQQAPARTTPQPQLPEGSRPVLDKDAARKLIKIYRNRIKGKPKNYEPVWHAMIEKFDLRSAVAVKDIYTVRGDATEERIRKWVKAWREAGLLAEVQRGSGRRPPTYRVFDPGPAQEPDLPDPPPGRRWVRDPDRARAVFDEFSPRLRQAYLSRPLYAFEQLRELWHALIDEMSSRGRLVPTREAIGMPFGWDADAVTQRFSTLIGHGLLVQIEKGTGTELVYAVAEPVPAGNAGAAPVYAVTAPESSDVEPVGPADGANHPPVQPDRLRGAEAGEPGLGSPGRAVVSARAIAAVRLAREGVGGAGDTPMQRLARWVQAVEAAPADTLWSAGDCVLLAGAAFAAAQGRPANRPVDDGIATEGLSWLVDALGVTWRGVGDVQQLVRAVAAAPGSMLLVRVRPPNEPTHVFWLVADDREATVVPRWVDPQVSGQFDRPALVSASLDWWAVRMGLPDTTVAAFDRHGRPTELPGLVDVAQGTATGRGRTGGGLDPASTSRAGMHPAAARSTRIGGGDAGDGPAAAPTEAEALILRLRAPWNSVAGTSGRHREDSDLTRRYGPDPFGLRDRPPVPNFMSHFMSRRDFDQLATDRLVSLFYWLNLVIPDRMVPVDASRLPPFPASVWWQQLDDRQLVWAPYADPSRLREHGSLPRVLEMPTVFHSIWLGSPLSGQRPATNAARGVLGRLADQVAGRMTVVVWTDVARSEFASPTGEVAEMRDWARQHNIVLVNVDEVFHAGAPMERASEYRLEWAKATPGGYGAASDILRLEILNRFGGVYTDVDNEFVSLDGLPALLNWPGFAVHRQNAPDGSAVSSTISALLAARGHPFVRLYLELLYQNYGRTQPQLYARDQPVPNARQEHEDAYMRDFDRWARRRSTMLRTGPDNLAHLAALTGVGTAGRFPGITEAQLVMGSGYSWIEGTSAPRYGDEQVVPMLRHAISYLVRDLGNRVGDLNLIAIAPIIERLPDPGVGWEAVIGFIHRWPAMRMRVRRATYRELIITNGRFGEQAQVGEWTLDLPPSVRALLGVPDRESTDQPSGEWIRGAFSADVPADNWSWLVVDFDEQSVQLQELHPDLEELSQQLITALRAGRRVRVMVEGDDGGLSRLGQPEGAQDSGPRRTQSVAQQLFGLLQQRNAETWTDRGRVDLNGVINLARNTRGAGPSRSPVPLTMTSPQEHRRVTVSWTIQASPSEQPPDQTPAGGATSHDAQVVAPAVAHPGDTAGSTTTHPAWRLRGGASPGDRTRTGTGRFEARTSPAETAPGWDDLVHQYRAAPNAGTGLDQILPILLNQPHLHQPIATLVAETTRDQPHHPAMIRAIGEALTGNADIAHDILRDARAHMTVEQRLDWIDRIQQHIPTLGTTAQEALNNLLAQLVRCLSPSGATVDAVS